MEKILNMTLKEVIDSGADVDVSYHFLKNEEVAYGKLKKFINLGKMVRRSHKGRTAWLGVSRDDLSVTAFYEVEESEDEK